MASVSKDDRGKKRSYVVNYRDAAGDGRRRSFPTAAKAEEFKARVELGQAGHADERTTLKAWVDSRIEFRYSDPAQIATRQQVEQRMRSHVFPYVGKAKLGKLDAAVVESWVVELKRKGLATSTIKLIASNLRTFVEDAVTAGILLRNPVAASTVKAKIAEDFSARPAWESEDEGEVAFWSPEWVVRVTEAIRPDLRLMPEISSGLGTRQGELLALAEDDFDFDAGLVRVRCQVKVLNGNRLVFADLKHRGQAKGKARERTVPLPPGLAEKVREHLDAGRAQEVTMPWAHPDGKLVTRKLLFVTREGKAWNRNYLNKHWHAALEEAGIPVERQNGMHSLRHYFASVLIDAGIPITAVASYLGHASAEFTLRIYGHRMEAADARALAALAVAERYTSGTQGDADNVVDLRKRA